LLQEERAKHCCCCCFCILLLPSWTQLWLAILCCIGENHKRCQSSCDALMRAAALVAKASLIAAALTGGATYTLPGDISTI
jgi:hypothetical protein